MTWHFDWNQAEKVLHVGTFFLLVIILIILWKER